MTALYLYHLWMIGGFKGNKVNFESEDRPLIGSFAYRSWHGFYRERKEKEDA